MWKTYTYNPIQRIPYRHVLRPTEVERGARKRWTKERLGEGIRRDHDPTTRRGIMDTIIRRKIRGPRNIFIISFHTYTVMQEASHTEDEEEGTNRVVLGGDRIWDAIPSSL